ncbi:MAG TPA: DUF2007 domain-containing protein [Ignavibacteria bacterium]|nr:DUF2007 domain-containing protein [Ignavibacteria bacterium]HAX49256.1 hypothetical protein [Bacteroidota bacterium]HRE10977.1 DUF2007 domain-containing protein [Ignavibacteria bacterium]HRF65187.1 DUF2007 domain-containing protein [Ignavibacteria bacterium]HRJ04017.1 DUF2007 domain-containing protein [Ignavibacteria bacterium]
MSNDENVNPGGIDSGNEGLNEEYLVSVFKTDNMAIIAVVKSILDEAGIKYMAKGENMQGVVPINAFPVDFQVMPEDEQYAKELLSEVDEDSDWYNEDSPDDSGEETPNP